MNILYLTQIHFISGRAHVHNVAKTCEAISSQPDTSIVLVSTDDGLLSSEAKDNFFKKHKIVKFYKIISLRSLGNYFKNRSLIIINQFGVALNIITLFVFVIRYKRKFDVLYFRDHLLLPVALFVKHVFRKKIYFESHYVLNKRHGQWLTEKSIKSADGVVAISHQLKNYYKNLNSNSIVSFCGAADVSDFDYVTPIAKLREKLSLPVSKKIIMYTGNLGLTGNYDVYQLDDVVKALSHLPEDYIFVAVGEKGNDANWIRKIADERNVSGRLIIVSWQDRGVIPLYLRAADVLVLPKRTKDMPGDSPIKMFEYFYARVPMVVGDAPAILEVMEDGLNSVVVRTHRGKDWAEAIEKVVEDSALSQRLKDTSFSQTSNFSWAKRGKDIAEFIKE